jgi:hypothetical protein
MVSIVKSTSEIENLNSAYSPIVSDSNILCEGLISCCPALCFLIDNEYNPHSQSTADIFISE